MSELEKAARQTLEALLKIERTVYHVERPPIESLEEQMRNIARKAITALHQALEQDHIPDAKKMVEQQPADEPVAKLWCETCDGTGQVYQEHQRGCWGGGQHTCPDCDGNGYYTRPQEFVCSTGLCHYKPDSHDLLEALQAAINYIDTLGGVSQRYRAAIAKATGEQS